MSIIRTPEPSEATGEVAVLYREDLDELGYVADYTRVMSVNPEAVRAFEALVRSIVAQLGKRRYELVTLAAAQALHSEHCRLAHGLKTLSLIDEDELERIARDYRNADLSEAEVAMMDYAQKVSRASHDMTDADTELLRDLGFTDREIVDITLAAAARNYYSRAIQALGAAVQVPPGLSDRLRGALLAPL
ncbi:carboxymuconolactone decarboxylase family protein [Leifsonia virtsii]|uniref:Peroxidase-related enzyme n=1 Tax=Leifsonia virtsii TaxID=3035915 RepID=A0ABT8ISC8_9MICO|nr:peroxidase-related enzyme [Leifsonia virtsii]MDN4595692.1 peroxidase-related enzyme [Leifsonia virtsii]